MNCNRLAKKSVIRVISVFLLVVFSATSSFAAPSAVFNLTPSSQFTPNKFVPLSGSYSPASLRGVIFNPQKPLELKFIVDKGGRDSVSQEEIAVLINYFFAGLTADTKDLWVNLSPTEPDRVIPGYLAKTELGEGMLKQDYLLKCLAASLTHPDTPTGKRYWSEINRLPGMQGSNEFNRVWIVPDKAVVYNGGNKGIIVESSLKAMSEEDYLVQNNYKLANQQLPDDVANAFKTHILPVINKEINQGKNFASLRQIYNSLILSIWFKKQFHNSWYSSYIDHAKVAGIDIADKEAKAKIYAAYVDSVKNGVYKYVKEDSKKGSLSHKRTAYFSGGLSIEGLPQHLLETHTTATAADILGPDCDILVEGRAYPVESAIPPVTAAHFFSPSAITSASVAKHVPGSLQLSPLPKISRSDLDHLLSTHNITSGFWRVLFNLYLEYLKGLRVNQVWMNDGANNGNAFGSALVPAVEQSRIFCTTPYDTIALNMTESGNHLTYDTIAYFFDAGLGVNLERSSFVLRNLGRAKIGAKNTDFGIFITIEGRQFFITGAEAKLASMIESKLHRCGRLTVVPIVNDDSKPPYDALLQQPYKVDIARGIAAPSTIKERLDKAGILFKTLRCELYPSLDVATGEPTFDRHSSASHSEWCYRFFDELLKMDVQRGVRQSIATLANADGWNNRVDTNMTDWMIRNCVPMVMVVTPTTRQDFKVGKAAAVVDMFVTVARNSFGSDGVAICDKLIKNHWAVPAGGGAVGLTVDLNPATQRHMAEVFNTDLSRGDVFTEKILPVLHAAVDSKLIPRTASGQVDWSRISRADVKLKLIEPADAKQFGQLRTHANLGVKGEHCVGAPGMQLLNLNSMAHANVLLAKILQAVLRDVYNGDDEEMRKVFLPDLIASLKPGPGGKDYVQLEGAYGSALLNIANALSAHRDPRIKAILRKYGVLEVGGILTEGEFNAALDGVPQGQRPKWIDFCNVLETNKWAAFAGAGKMRITARSEDNVGKVKRRDQQLAFMKKAFSEGPGMGPVFAEKILPVLQPLETMPEILHLIVIPEKDRAFFFTPTKNALDFWWYLRTSRYSCAGVASDGGAFRLVDHFANQSLPRLTDLNDDMGGMARRDFVGVVSDAGTVWRSLVENGFMDNDGLITDKFKDIADKYADHWDKVNAEFSLPNILEAKTVYDIMLKRYKRDRRFYMDIDRAQLANGRADVEGLDEFVVEGSPVVFTEASADDFADFTNSKYKLPDRADQLAGKIDHMSGENFSLRVKNTCHVKNLTGEIINLRDIIKDKGGVRKINSNGIPRMFFDYNRKLCIIVKRGSVYIGRMTDSALVLDDADIEVRNIEDVQLPVNVYRGDDPATHADAEGSSEPVHVDERQRLAKERTDTTAILAGNLDAATAALRRHLARGIRVDDPVDNQDAGGLLFNATAIKEVGKTTNPAAVVALGVEAKGLVYKIKSCLPAKSSSETLSL